MGAAQSQVEGFTRFSNFRIAEMRDQICTCFVPAVVG